MNQNTALQKQIGFWSATALVVGSIIGSGVFMKPSSMAAQLGSPVWLTLVWIIAGLFSLFGALIFAELGGIMPKTGGIYVYFRQMFGEAVAFLFGWSAFAVINTASVAAISFVCAQYADYFLQLPRFDEATELSVVWHLPFIGDLYPLKNFGVKSLAVSIILLITIINYLSVKTSSGLQVVATFIKVVVLAALVFGIFFSGNGSFDHFMEARDPKEGWSLKSGIVAAMTGAFFAYDGWTNVTYVAGEIKQPQKNVPRSLWIGVVCCILVYVLVNQAYLYALPVEKIATSSLVAADAIENALGKTGVAIVAAMIVISAFGSINGNLMAPARVTYAMGKDRIFFSWAGKENRFKLPGNALLLHALWTSIFILTGSFDMLADMFVFVTWIAYGLGAVGVIILRKREPEVPRPYKIWGYPFVPILFIAFSAFYLGFTLYNDISNYLGGRQPVINSLLGLAIILLGLPLYIYFKRRK